MLQNLFRPYHPIQESATPLVDIEFLAPYHIYGTLWRETFVETYFHICKGQHFCSTGVSLSNRWNFIQASNNVKTEKKRTRSVGIYRRSLQKRLLHHKQKLKDLEQAKKTFMSQEKEGQVNHTLYKQQEKQFHKELSKFASKVQT